jgi:hypothetical protein
LEWTCAELVGHLKEHTDPPISQSYLDGFDMQEINGACQAIRHHHHQHSLLRSHTHAALPDRVMCAHTRPGFALASVRPPTLFRMIKEQVEQGPHADKIEVSDQLLQETLLGTATYSMQRR